LSAQVVPAAIGAARGTVTLTYYPAHTVYSGLHAEPERDLSAAMRGFAAEGALPLCELERIRQMDAVEVTSCQMMTLAELLECTDQVGLLKVDVEGAETQILASLSRDEWSRIQQIIVEVHDGGKVLRDVRGMLTSAGMSVAIKRDSFGTDDFLLYGSRAHD
jgi:FkbM family methyltransferase